MYRMIWNFVYKNAQERIIKKTLLDKISRFDTKVKNIFENSHIHIV